MSEDKTETGEGRAYASVPDSGTVIVQSGYGRGCPFVQGACPACGARSLFVGSAGYVTCAGPLCGDPSAPSKLLDPPPASGDLQARP